MSSPYILMLEYDEDDRYISRQYFHESSVPITFLNTSTELIEYLENGVKKKAALPSIIVLDYYSSPLNAVELLKRIKANKQYNHIPVIVLSGTKTEEMVHECYALGASSFIKKPTLVEETNNKINTFIDYWFKTVEISN